jgi:Na+-transporting methylmalonyl-CoA/oxaloacetate decarboxylase gamma subunit
MNPTVTELLGQGLTMTVLGMGLVFAGLGLLWGLMVLLTRLFKPEREEETGAEESPIAEARPATPPPETAPAETLTAERARIAAIVAAALMANAIPVHMEAPPEPAFEHGRISPSWVSINRARVLQSWQPPRFTERTLTSYD